jgi:tetratricopeptide (TPR) repeat protein
MLQNEYDAVFERVSRVAADHLDASSREAEAAGLLLPALLEQGAADREVALADPRYESYELARLLLARSLARWPADPFAAMKAASLAVGIADRLAASRYGTGPVEELRAQAWAYLGNTLRIVGDLRPAATALRIAAEHLVAAGCDPLLEAEILSFTASLRDSEGQPAKALPLIDRARAIYRSADDRRLEGRALVTKGMLLGNACRYGKALSLIRKGLALLAMEDEPALVSGAQHNMASFLAASGRPRQARDLLAENRRLYIELGNRSLLLRLRWLDGFIARQLGDLTASESFLWLARDGFLEHGIELDAALATLDIAEICRLQGHDSYAKRLTAEAIPVLESYGAVRQAEAARRFFAKVGG